MKNGLKEKLEKKSVFDALNIDLKFTENNQYSDDVRKTLISLQVEGGVAAANVSKVIKIVSQNILHHKFTQKLLCAQAAINMFDEGFFINYFQVAESVINSTNITLLEC